MPATLVARSVIVFVPTSKGIPGILHVLVPVAVPDPPAEFVQVTEAMPPLSRAVPFTDIVLAEVETLVRAGERTVKLGGAVLFPDAGAA